MAVFESFTALIAPLSPVIVKKGPFSLEPDVSPLREYRPLLPIRKNGPENVPGSSYDPTTLIL